MWIAALSAAALLMVKPDSATPRPPAAPLPPGPRDLRAMAVEIATHAVRGADGKPRHLGDPVFDTVTEGRAVWPGYSACGDLPQYVYQALGLEGPWTNRGARWVPGRAMRALVFETGAAFRWAETSPESIPDPGDTAFFRRTDGTISEHVAIVATADASSLTSCDYGSRDGRGPTTHGPTRRELTRSGGRRFIVNGQEFAGWVSLAALAAQRPLAMSGESEPLAVAWLAEEGRWTPFPDPGRYGARRWEPLERVASALALHARFARTKTRVYVEQAAWIKEGNTWRWKTGPTLEGDVKQISAALVAPLARSAAWARA